MKSYDDADYQFNLVGCGRVCDYTTDELLQLFADCREWEREPENSYVKDLLYEDRFALMHALFLRGIDVYPE